MRRAPCCQTFWARCLIAILVPMLALALTEFLAGGSPAQGAPPKKRPKQKPPEEEIDPGAAKKPPKPPLRVPGSTKPASKGTGKNAPETLDQADSGLTILAREAKNAPDRDQRELFASLAHPYDRIVIGTLQPPVVPVATYLGDPPSFEGQMMIRRYEDGKAGKALPYTERDIKGYQPYEDIAIEAVDNYLTRMQTRSGTTPTLGELKAAGKVLDAVLRWHLSALQRGTRLGDGWGRFEKKLRDKLLDVLLQQLKILVDNKQWEPAYGLTTRLADDYPKDKRVEAATLRFLAAQAHDSVDRAGASNSNEDWRKVARAFRDLQQRFPDSAAVGEIRPELENKARSLKASAEKELKAGQNAKAIELLRDAESLWPQLDGLHESLIRISGQYLYVGVPQLPIHLSPATAATDTERQTLELLFESLVRPTHDDKFGQRYVLELAAQQPTMIPLGRHFVLRKDLAWSNGKFLSGSDVRSTVSHLIRGGRANMLQPVVLLGTDNWQVDLKLKQGYVDPLSLMTFKILPTGLNGLDDQKFASKPIGSGPFRLKSRTQDEVVFEANPYYGNRQGIAGLPRIQEIHFFVSNDHRGDFTDQAKGISHKMDLLLGLSTKDVTEISSLEQVHVKSKRNRRIYFLAVNHRRAALQNLEVRKVIANAINREAILDDVFRDPNSTNKPHRVLAGAYLPDTWPYTPVDAFAPQVAQASAAGLDGTVALTLKYPDGDPDAQAACQRIAEAVGRYKIKLTLQAVEEAQLRQEVEHSHEYDLAYYHWDYASEDYSLWPLFDPDAMENGTNYLGYADSELTSYLQRLNTVRDMHKMQEAAHTVQKLVRSKLPFIPLWQLDTFFAYHDDLSVTDNVDPLLIFNNVAHWELHKH